MVKNMPSRSLARRAVGDDEESMESDVTPIPRWKWPALERDERPACDGANPPTHDLVRIRARRPRQGAG
jgi:hypothetical protein